MSDYTQTKEYQAFLADAAKLCRCKHGPCAGVLQGGPCDEMDDWEDEESDEWWEDDDE